MLIKISFRHIIMFMSQAFTIAERSYAKDLKVGTLLIKQLKSGIHQVISDGYNGTEPGESNCCEDKHGESKKDVIHAEKNLFMKLSENDILSNDTILFVTRSPCIKCVELIILMRVKQVYFCEKHHNNEPIEKLISNNIMVTQVDKKHIINYFNNITERLKQEKFNVCEYSVSHTSR